MQAPTDFWQPYLSESLIEKGKCRENQDWAIYTLLSDMYVFISSNLFTQLLVKSTSPTVSHNIAHCQSCACPGSLCLLV